MYVGSWETQLQLVRLIQQQESILNIGTIRWGDESWKWVKYKVISGGSPDIYTFQGAVGTVYVLPWTVETYQLFMICTY